MPAEPRSSSTIRVFLVDDDEVERLSIERLLKDAADIELYVFASGETALTELEVVHCDCLLLACRTPDLGGLELLERLNRAELNVPAILLTGAGKEAPVVGSMHRGVLDFIDEDALTSALLLTKIRAANRLHEVGERARVAERELQETIEGLRREIHVRENMIAVVSHDLSGPLNNIGLAMTLLETDDSSLRATALDSVRRALARAERLIGDLVDLARILDSGFEIDRRRVGARGLIEAVVLDEQWAAQAKRVEIVIDVPEDLGDVYADRDRVIQVLDNLLRNALVHAPESGTITVQARPRGDDEVEFAVVDERPGISPALRTNMLDRFWQSKDSNRLAGSDLGLAIAQGIVIAHGGEIGIDSVPDGVRFWFTIRRPTAPKW